MLKYSPSTFPLCLFFRQNLVTQCILNSQSCTHKEFSLSLSLSTPSPSPSFSIEQNEADFLFPS